MSPSTSQVMPFRERSTSRPARTELGLALYESSMIQLSRAPGLSCNRPETARKSASPAAICSREAPAAPAAAAAPSALLMLCAPPALSVTERSPSGHTRVKRVAKLAALDCLNGIFRHEIGTAVYCEGDYARCGGHTAPIAGIGVVGIDDGRPFGGQTGHHFTLAPCHPHRDCRNLRDVRRRRW